MFKSAVPCKPLTSRMGRIDSWTVGVNQNDSFEWITLQEISMCDLTIHHIVEYLDQGLQTLCTAQRLVSVHTALELQRFRFFMQASFDRCSEVKLILIQWK